VSELERQLTQLGRELDWPAAPDLASSTVARLRAEGAAPAPADGAAGPASADAGPRGARVRPARRRFLPPAGLRRSLALAVLALLLLAGGVFAAVPSVRDSVLDFFGLRGATVERREQLPQKPRPRPPVPGGRLSLEYKARAGLPRATSTGLGLLVDEFRGDLNPQYAAKIAGATTRIEPFTLDGEHAIWVSGAPHFFFYRSPANDFQERNLRIAQNVLLLEHGRLLVRLEGAFGKARAIELARSLG
jgi:hypothetical protein